VATAVDKLLMMGMMMPETCWAVFKRQAINMKYWCIWLVDLFECIFLSSLLYRALLFQYLLYCSNSYTSLYFKTLKSHTKTLKIRPYMFRSSLKPSSKSPWPYFARLLNWNVDLHLL
jgi:hypothetical protein